ncbi:MAG TPA: helix-turn-helix domain-containing protein [Candidatus Angelobacter sp.]|jgi:hypothetical protein|nr:helix-turn-helix domain-containing protein [Candidatus Angelobacter sp.]
MNTITIQITGQITLDPQDLAQFLECVQIQTPAPVPIPAPTVSKTDTKLAYSVKETAEMLGVAAKSVHRLIARGLLKSSSALRCKRIPKSEIERFLKTTTGY